MSQSYGCPTRESLATIHRARLGVTLFDAEAYGPFKNEELLGRALKEVRPRVIIATKFGWRFQDGKWWAPIAGRRVSRSRGWIAATAGHHYIDLLYQHRIDRRCRSRTPWARWRIW
jgi:aryl-alcohol dehydrogenase-like predicted oxidoreductase